jgi:hypothetical protein
MTIPRPPAFKNGMSTLPSARWRARRRRVNPLLVARDRAQLATRADAFDDTIDLRGFGILYAILVGLAQLRFISGLLGSEMIGSAMCRQARRERGSRRIRAGEGRRSTRPGHTCAVRVDTQIVRPPPLAEPGDAPPTPVGEAPTLDGMGGLLTVPTPLPKVSEPIFGPAVCAPLPLEAPAAPVLERATGMACKPP